jgi:hypothetical protein
MKDETPVPIKAYGPNDLCNFYGITWPTLNKWIKLIPNLSPRIGNIYTPAQVKIIFEHHGHPTQK